MLEKINVKAKAAVFSESGIQHYELEEDKDTKKRINLIIKQSKKSKLNVVNM